MTTTEQLEIALKAIQEKGDKFAALMPDRFEFDVETKHHNDRNHALIERLKSVLDSKGYCSYESWNKEYDTKRYTFFKPPGLAPY